jgi:hypothetical protein
MIRIVAGRGLGQTESAAQIEEARDFILWFFGPGSWIFNRVAGNTGTAILFQGVPATATLHSPVLALHSDGRIFRGDTRHLTTTGNAITFAFDYNQSPNVPSYLKIKVFQGGNWVDAP